MAGEATIALAASTAVTVSNDITVAGRATGTQTADNDGNFDLTVTTQETVNIDELVTFEGTIALDKDFGAGYFYPIIMEEAVIIK